MIPRDELLRVRRLASRANARVKDWAALHDRSRREETGLTLAEGARLVAEGLETAGGDGRFRPVALLVSDAGAGHPDAGRLFALAGSRGLERFSLSDDCFAKISGLKHADGVALVLSCDYGEADPGLLDGPDARWLVAAGVQDPGNAGALARTALAADCTGCLFLEGADPRSPKFLRGAMGAAFRLPCLGMSLDTFLAAWSASPRTLLVATAAADAVDYRDAGYAPPCFLLVGGERGIPEALSRLDGVRVRIPLAGGVESLNLAVAAGIILFEARRAWGEGGHT